MQNPAKHSEGYGGASELGNLLDATMESSSRQLRDLSSCYRRQPAEIDFSL